MAQKTKSNQLRNEVLFEIYGIIILTLSLITLADYGAIGRNLSFICKVLIGNYDFMIPLYFIFVGFYTMIKQKWPIGWSYRILGILLIVTSLISFSHYLSFQAIKSGSSLSILDMTWSYIFEDRGRGTSHDVGTGMIGAIIYAVLYFLFDDTGTVVVLSSVMLSGILMLTDFSYFKMVDILGDKGENKTEKLKNKINDLIKNKKLKPEIATSITDELVQIQDIPLEKPASPVIHDFEDRAYAEAKELSDYETTADINFQTNDQNNNYIMPSTQLLSLKKKSKTNKIDVAAKSEVLTKTLSSFGVQAKVIAIHRGPAVTRYELQPESGVKVSRIVNLTDDISLALAAKDIRIEAPIPGKSAVGIEVPNEEVAMVGLRELLEDRAFEQSASPLTISLGRAISGEPIYADLSKMPHMLIAGSTGAGKSVFINSLVISLLYKAKPSEVKLIMIDPKMVELTVFNGIPHLLVPVVTDPRKASIALKKVVSEMGKRYEQFANAGARDIDRYNQIVSEEGKATLPYIVVIVDELADLMMIAASDVEDSICRLAQMARAAGIHLVIATQRPSVDVITGVIKANIPSRVSFAVASQIDSRTILDMGGADKLLGKGDMLYMPIGSSKPTRVQGSFVTDIEVEGVIKFVCEQQEPRYVEEMIPTANDIQTSTDIEDELYGQAVKTILEAKTASVSFLQRKLRVGYARAARLIDMMEERGLIGSYEGSKPREILITLEEYERSISTQQIKE